MAKRPRWKLIIWLLLAAALVIGVIVVVRAYQEPGKVVRAYLEAVRAGDVETALTYVRDSGQLDRKVPLLTDTAGGDWEIIELEKEGFHGFYDDSISFRLRLGVDGREVPFEDGEPESISLHRKPDGDWQINLPLSSLVVQDSPLRYIDIGRAPEPLQPERRHYLIFPGVHPVNTHPTGLVTAAGPKRIAAGPGTNHEMPNDVVLTEQGKAAADEALRRHLDTCAAELAPDGCPFGVGGSVKIDVETTLLDVADVTYAMTQYPEVEVEPSGRAFSTSPPDTAQVRVNGTGTDEVSQRRPFTIDCAFTTWLGVTLDVNDRMIVTSTLPNNATVARCGRT